MPLQKQRLLIIECTSHITKHIMMKKRALFFATFLIIAAGLTSCEELFTNCKMCRLNTYEDGQLVNTAQEAEYCGTELITIEATPDATVGNTTTKWECD